MPTRANDPANVDSFLNAIVKSGLINYDQMQEYLSEFPDECRSNSQSLADQLIKKGRLSSFQAQKLLKGTYSGLLLGPYEIMAPIGKGGMGAVYLARDTRLQKLLALKVLPPKLAKKNERMTIRFQRELDINKRVAHPHIAWTYEGGMLQGVFYIAMEYIPGKTLSRIVAERGPFEVSQLARIAVEVSLGLHHAHTQGIIHRDLKPSNIMLTPNGHAKILDLGLALVEGEVGGIREVVGGQGYVVGSMDYIAPEQIKDAAGVDARADIYSFGCTLFYALTGRPPFPGGTAKEKMQRHRKEAPPPLRELNEAVPDKFALIVHKMMAKRPEYRYASMKEVRELLMEWAAEVEQPLPMDQSGEASFQEAVKALQTEEAPSEMVNMTIAGKQEISDSVDTPKTSWLWRVLPLDEQQRGYFWLCAGIVGFWVVVLGLLGIVLLLRR